MVNLSFLSAILSHLGCNIQNGNILSMTSDHPPQFCILSDFTCDCKYLSQLFYDYSRFDASKFLMDYSNMDLSFLNDNHIGLNAKFDQFLHNLCSHINNHWPQKRMCKKRLKLRNKPWIILHISCLYNSLFSSFLNYGIIVWGLTFENYLTPLFLLQNKILRCLNFQLLSVPSTSLFHSLRILKLEDLFHLNHLIFFIKL